MLVHFANAGFIAKPTYGGGAPRDRLVYLHHATIASSFVAVASPSVSAVTPFLRTRPPNACLLPAPANERAQRFNNVTHLVLFLECIFKTRRSERLQYVDRFTE